MTCRSRCSRCAASAIYTTRDVQGVSPARLRRFFLLGRGPREGSFRVVPEIRDLVKFRHIDLRNPSWPVPADFPDHLLPERFDLFCRGRAIDTFEPPGAAPAPGRLAGHGQRRDPAGCSPLTPQTFTVAISKGGLSSHGSARTAHDSTTRR